MAEPRDADPFTHAETLDTGADHVDPTDNLVTGDDRRLWIGQFTVEDVQVGAANAACEHLHPDLAGPGLSVRHFCPLKGSLRPLQHHRLHNLGPFVLKAGFRKKFVLNN